MIPGWGLYSQSRGFTSYSVADGLAQSNVIDITEDQLGNLWLATEGGLSKFNGVEFATYKKQDGLTSNQLYCLSVNTGKIWIGTDYGVSSFDGQTFQNYSIPALEQDDWVRKITADSYGNIWYAKATGSAAFIAIEEGSPNFHYFNETIVGKVSGFAETKDAMWISTYRDGIYKYHYEAARLEKVLTGTVPDSAMITAIYSNDGQKIWLAADNQLFAWKNGSYEFIHSFDADYREFRIYSIIEEQEGTVWVGTTRGAFRLHNGFSYPVNASDGLTDNIVYKIHRDREGTLWFGSFGGGLYKSLGELFTKIGKEQGVSYDYISSITRDKSGHYWFGSYGGGIYRVIIPSSPGKSILVKSYDHEQGLSNDFIYGIVPDNKGSLWIATMNGLNRLKDGSITCYYQEQGLPANQIYSLLKCRDGTFYCGTSSGLSRIELANGVKFTNYQYDGNKPHNRIRTLLETAEGQILLGTFGGLKFFDGQSVKDYFESDSLKSLPVSTMHEDKQGILWCALADNGILRYDPKSVSARQFTEQLGLSSNIVYSLVTDNFGNLWVGTPHGLDKIGFTATGSIEQIRHFGAYEGFFGIETNTNAVYKESDGSFWLGTVEGAFKCLPEMDKMNLLEPISSITGVRLFSQKMEWTQDNRQDRGWFNLPRHIKLPYHQNHITFEFFGNSLLNPEKVSYQYKLENFDPDWQPVTRKNEAVYTNLPPGSYTFQVKASNNDGIWNQVPATISLEITPPYWRTWWFFALAIAVLGVAGRLYYKSRVQTKLNALMQVEKIKNAETIKVRRRVAEDFHDQVGNQLASITVLVQLIQAKLSTPNHDVEELLQKLGQFTKKLFIGTRDFIWSIDPKSDRVNEMLIYIRDFGEELFEYSNVNFHVETNNAFDANTQLPVGWSRHIVFIFKEALTNSLKHADCKNVYLNFNVTDHKYLFELRDDGKGLNGYSDNDFMGMGLKSMKDRARKIGGEIVISSDQNAGTRITLEGKIPQNEG